MTKDAIKLLKEDHKIVQKLLDQLTDTTNRAGKTRTQLLQQIEQELKVHAEIEEQIFYPAFKAAGEEENREMYFEAMEEHRAVMALVLPDLKNTNPASDEFSGRAKVLKEMIEHHIEEEEKEMFKQARESMSDETLEHLGEKMKARKQKLQQQMAA